MPLTQHGNTVVIDVVANYVDNLSPGVARSTSVLNNLDRVVTNTRTELNRLNNTNTSVSVNDQATSKLDQIMATARRFAGGTFRATIGIIDNATAPLRMIYNSLFNLKTLAMTVSGLVMGKLMVGNSIALADQLETAQIGFENILGSAQEAQKFMGGIKEFARTTPFDTSGVVSGVQQMLNSGWDISNVMEDMRTIGDAAAAVGGANTENLSGILLAINQMRMAGKVNSQDMMQMTNRGLPAWQLLADAYGVSTTEIRKMTKDGKIDAETAIQAMLQAMKERYGGMMESNSTRTVNGIMSNLEDTFNIKILERWGYGLQEGVIGGLSKMATFLDQIDPLLTSVGDKLYALGSFLGDKFARVVTTLTSRFRSEFMVFDADLQEWLMRPELADASLGELAGMAMNIISGSIDEWWNNGGEDFAIDIGGKIAKAIAKGFGGMFKEAFKLAPGGDSASPLSLLSALYLGKTFSPVASPVLRGLFGALGKGGDALGRVTGVGSVLGRATLFGRLAFGAGSIWNMATSDDKGKAIAQTGETIVGGLAGSKLGGLVGGAIGTLAGPAGTAVGAAVGSVLGGFLGSSVLPIVDEKLGIFDAIRYDFSNLADAWPGMWQGAIDNIVGLFRDFIGGSTIASIIRDAFVGMIPGGVSTGENAGSVTPHKVSGNTMINSRGKLYKATLNKNGIGSAITPYAEGGLYSTPHMGLLGEDGPEAIIPLSGKHRGRGLSLLRQAQSAMGVSSGSGVSVGGVTVNISVAGGDSVASAISAQSDEIKEAITGVLYSAMAEVYANKPVMA